MKVRFYLIAAAFAFASAAAHADELTKTAQNSLKDQGFYYGEVTGINGPETTAAIKRYQIRNGLEVTGTLNKETLTALGMANEAPAGVPPPKLTPPAVSKKAAPVAPQSPNSRPPSNLRKDRSAEKSDQEYLHRQQPLPPPDEPPTSSPLPPSTGGSGPYAQLFAQTPYATAPLEVQQGTAKQAQKKMRDLGLYRGPIDGQPGADMEEGVLSYQHFIGLPLTGQLDLETLASLRLLPGRGGAPAQPQNPMIRRAPGQPLRGVWIR
jgi:peptidoglycan hydrolase-like protein with peptidoglycan-binding domain